MSTTLFILPVAYIFISGMVLAHIGESIETFNYERHYKFAPGRKIIPSLRRMMPRYEYPEPLPSTKKDYVRSPYKSIYQGARKSTDKRVFRRKFSYEPQASGHHIVCEGMVDCIISHISVETTHGIPILMRGGTGYHYFSVVAKANPGEELVGTVRVYCREMEKARRMGHAETRGR